MELHIGGGRVEMGRAINGASSIRSNCEVCSFEFVVPDFNLTTANNKWNDYNDRRSKRRVLHTWLRRTEAGIAGRDSRIEAERHHRRRCLRGAIRRWAVAGVELRLRREQGGASRMHSDRCDIFWYSGVACHFLFGALCRSGAKFTL